MGQGDARLTSQGSRQWLSIQTLEPNYVQVLLLLLVSFVMLGKSFSVPQFPHL